MSATIEAIIPTMPEALPVVMPDKYYHFLETEESNPELAKAAWQIHAEGYIAMGFVKPEAITEEGFLPADIDKARGSNVNYMLALSSENQDDCATMRVVSVPEGGSFRDLPAYGLTRDILPDESLSLLEELEDQGRAIKEISALARSRAASPASIFELFRKSIHEALGKDEAWFFTMVSSTHETLIPRLTSENFQVLGDDVKIDDERVGEGIALRPLMLRPDEFIENIYRGYLNAGNEVDKRRLAKSLIFYTDGLAKEQMTALVFDERTRLTAVR